MELICTTVSFSKGRKSKDFPRFAEYFKRFSEDLPFLMISSISSNYPKIAKHFLNPKNV